MGAGNSKFNAAYVMTTRIRPQLSRRFEELRKGKNGPLQEEGSTLSKKELLKHAAEEEENKSPSYRETEAEETVVQSSPNGAEAAKEEKVVRTPILEMLSDSESEAAEVQDKETVKDVVVDEKLIIDVVEQTKEGKTAENEDDHDDDDDDEEDDDDNEELGRYISPGSPSFRIYCVEAGKNNKEGCNNETMAMHQKPPRPSLIQQKSASFNSFRLPAPPVKHHKTASVDSVLSTVSGDSNEGVEIGSSTKRNAKPKKKYGAVKNLLNVKCGCTGYERSRDMAAKAAI